MDGLLTDALAGLRAGRLVLHPTEAVWGLACDPGNARAVAGLYALKRRPAGKGLILIADDFERLAPLLSALPADRMRAVLATWPGPHTWVFPAAAACPDWLAGERGSLAVRVTAHPLARCLSAAFAGPLVSTSANRSGQPAPTRLVDVDPAIREGVAVILPGATGGLDRPTPVRDALTGALLRD